MPRPPRVPSPALAGVPAAPKQAAGPAATHHLVLPAADGQTPRAMPHQAPDAAQPTSPFAHASSNAAAAAGGVGVVLGELAVPLATRSLVEGGRMGSGKSRSPADRTGVLLPPPGAGQPRRGDRGRAVGVETDHRPERLDPPAAEGEQS